MIITPYLGCETMREVRKGINQRDIKKDATNSIIADLLKNRIFTGINCSRKLVL